MRGAKPKNLVQTIERVATIFDILGQCPNGLALRERAHQAGLPKGTAHRLLTSMAYFDYIDKVELHPKASGLRMISRLGSRIALIRVIQPEPFLQHCPVPLIVG